MSKKETKKKLNKKIIWATVLSVALIILVVSFFIYYSTDKTSPAVEENNLGEEIEDIKQEPSEEITQFHLFIAKLDIDVPIIPNVDGGNKDEYYRALTGGVAHFKGTHLPGSDNNIFIFGHSSSPETVRGDYDKIFATLNNITIGDEILIKFNQKDYKYTVSEKRIVASSDVSVLDPTPDEQLTLMTCWPIGSNQKRLIVVARPE